MSMQEELPTTDAPPQEPVIVTPPPASTRARKDKAVAMVVADAPRELTQRVASDIAEFELKQRKCKLIAASSIVPDAYQNNMPNVYIALDLAERLHCTPLAVMQNLNVIHGRPSFGASFLINSVNQSGKFSPLRFRFQGTEGADDWGCRAVARDKDSGEELLGSLITIRMAKEEGWATKKGSKWLTMAEQMLMYRCATFWVRVYAPECSIGSTQEEVIDTVGVDITDIRAASSLTRGNAKVLDAELVANVDTTTGEVTEGTAAE